MQDDTLTLQETIDDLRLHNASYKANLLISKNRSLTLEKESRTLREELEVMRITKERAEEARHKATEHADKLKIEAQALRDSLNRFLDLVNEGGAIGRAD